MRVLAVGDVVGDAGCRFLRQRLPALKRYYGVDLTVANGENSAEGNGVTPASARFLFDSGVGVLTGGNHSFRRRECYALYEQEPCLLRPANYPKSAPGSGLCVYDMGRVQVAVISLQGTAFMDALADPFDTLEALLRTPDLPRVRLVDFHAEATGEKCALACAFDGQVSALFGTHTHVQTADECVLPKGTGYVTDLGMTGPVDSVLGVRAELVIEHLRTRLPVRFETAPGPCRLEGALFDVDERTGLCTGVQRIRVE